MMWSVLPIALSTFIFYPILRNYFFGDDLFNLYRIVNAPLGTYLLTPYAGHILVARNFVFYLCFRFFGTEAQAYFWLMLLTHLLNVALLFSVVRMLTGNRYSAAFAATVWGSAPLHEGSLGWYSVYGNVMVGTVTLWLLRDLALCANGRNLGSTRLLSWPLLLFIACTSFGVGLALALVFPILVAVVHPPTTHRARAVLCSVAVAVTVLPAYFAVHRMMLTAEAAAIATSTLNMGTLTLWRPILGMMNDLAGYGLFSLILRDAVTRIPYTSTAGFTLIAITTVVILLGLIRGDRRARGILVASIVLTLATFGVVAAGRGVLWGKDFFLATRYQYVPLLGIVIAVTVALTAMIKRRLHPRFKAIAFALWTVAALILSATLSPGIDHHANARRATDLEISAMRRTINATPAGQSVYIQNQVFHGVGPMLIRNPKMFPGWAAAFTIFFPSNVIDGKPVFFIESDAEIRDAVRSDRRTGTLLVADR